MAFVYRKQKNEQLHVDKIPGPGEYNTLTENTHTNCSVSFADKVQRKLWQIPSTPGPGQYNCSNQNLVHEGYQVPLGDSSGICVIESFYNKTSGWSSNFKSKSKRLIINKENTPGPGQYQVIRQIAKNQSNPARNWQKATKLTKYLFQERKRQNNRTIDQQPIQFDIKKQIFGDEIHCQHKNVRENNIKGNYKSVFNSKVQRKIISRPQTAATVGPGSYNIQKQKQVSKKYFVNKKIQQNYSLNKQNEKIKDEVGPGYYNYETSSLKRPQTSQSKGIACFGSKQSRFCNKFIQNNKKNPGPQAYFRPNRKVSDQVIKKDTKRVPFNSGANKDQLFFNLKPSTISTEVSPCTYNPKNDFNELLKKNFVKSAIGKFGSTVQRFKQYQPKQQNNINQGFLSMIACEQFQYNENRSKKVNKYKKFIKRSQPIKKQREIDERPLSYDTNSKTICEKFSTKKQIQAPFMTGSERFHLKKPNYQQQIIDKIKQQQQKSMIIKGNNQREVKRYGKIHKGSSKNDSVMGKYISIVKKIKKNSIQNQNSAIGPQTYNPTPIGKKQFNVLFHQ